MQRVVALSLVFLRSVVVYISVGSSDIDVLYSDIPNTTDNLQLLTLHLTAGNSVVTKNIAYWGILLVFENKYQRAKRMAFCFLT